MIAVASGKGGTGKTLLSSAMALSVESCAYVDLDVEEPNGAVLVKPGIIEKESFGLPVPVFHDDVCTHCGDCARACAYNALAVIPKAEKTMFFPELCHFCGACSFVCPVEGAVTEQEKEIGVIRKGRANGIHFIEGRLNIGQPSAVPLIKGVLDRVESVPLVIADCPPGTSCPVVESVRHADYVVLVTEPTPFGLNDLELAVQLVKDLGKPMGVIINKAGNDDPIDSFTCAENIPVHLRVPYSLDIQRGYSQGRPLTEIIPDIVEPLRRMIRNITAMDKRDKS